MTTKMRRQAEVLAATARDFSHPMLPKKGKEVLQGSALLVLELVAKVEQLEARLADHEQAAKQ